MKILIIDDNEQDRKITSRYVAKDGWNDVLLAENGEAGLKLAAGQRPDVVLVDTMMPGMDGFEACRRIKELFGPKMLVIIMTGRVAAVDAEKAKESGADEYCAKTADCAALLAALRRLFPMIPTAKQDTKPLSSPAAPGIPAKDSPDWGAAKTDQTIRCLSEELEKKNEQLKEFDKLKSKFLANVSHELKTPLTVIDGAIAQILAEIYGPVTDQQKKKMEMALKHSRRLKEMIDLLLDLAKFEAKKMSLKKEMVLCDDVIRDIQESFYTMAQEQGIGLRSECLNRSVSIQADRNRLLQVLSNFVDNALKFTAQGEIVLGVREVAEHVEFRVSDTGEGISERDVEIVFDRFQQLREEAHSGLRGSGLGLSICKEIVEWHGGKIWVESQLKKGSTFFFTIPKGSG